MTFNELKNQPVSSKIVLLEIDIPVLCEVFINYEAGIWRCRLSPAVNGVVTVTGSDSLVGYYDDDDNQRYIIGSLKIGTEDYTKCNTLAECRAQDSSFYYDRDTTDLYVHFTDFEYPLDKLVRPGAVNGYCDKADATRDEKSTYEDVYYDPRIVKLPSLSNSKDPLFFGVMSFQSGSVSMQNLDGHFDGYPDLDVYGQPVRVYLGFAGFERDEFVQVYGGFIEDFSDNKKEFTINIQDPRKRLSRSIPVNKFTTTEYSLIDDGDVDKPIPLIYGTVRKIAGTYIGGKYFVIADCTYHTLKSVTCYIDGVVTSITGGLDGVVYIPTYDEDAGSEVLFDVEGFIDDDDELIDNGLDVIADILYYYADISFLSINYNLIEWADEKARARTVGLWISDLTEITSVIEQICVALDGVFIPQPDGRFTFRSYDEDREPVRTIYPDEWLDLHKISYDAAEFLSSCVIKYNQNYNPGEDEADYYTYSNRVYEAAAVRQYKMYQEKEFETCLTDDADAVAKSEVIMGRSKIITPLVENKTKTQNVDLEIGQFVVADHGRPNATTRSWGVYEVLSVGLNLTKAEVSLKLKYVTSYTMTETKYTQGRLLGDGLLGDTMLGPSIYEEVAA